MCKTKIRKPTAASLASPGSDPVPRWNGWQLGSLAEHLLVFVWCVFEWAEPGSGVSFLFFFFVLCFGKGVKQLMWFAPLLQFDLPCMFSVSALFGWFSDACHEHLSGIWKTRQHTAFEFEHIFLKDKSNLAFKKKWMKPNQPISQS